MNKTFIGIDPGKTGFIAISNKETGGYKFHQIPLIAGKVIDTSALAKIFQNIKKESMKSGSELFCAIEDVHAIFGSSAKATFAFGYITGMIVGMISSMNIPYVKVQPKKWQKQMWEGIHISGKVDTKKISEIAAKRLFPNIDFRTNPESKRAKKNDHNKIDSCLICEYAKRNY